VSEQDRAIADAVRRLEAWLETTRGPGGYGGPVAHWWQNSLAYTGPGLDWRYEGLVHGYLNLHRATGDAGWLARARRAGDDLLQGQLASGNFRNSSFELNPGSGGTPHEAAADLALLALAMALREAGDPSWEAYRGAAVRNLEDYYVAVLWDAEAGAFRDHPTVPSLVPNKACTLAEALLAWGELDGSDKPTARYALLTLEAACRLQVRGGPLDGAIAQYSQSGHIVEKYFPYYTARCVPGLLAGFAYGKDEHLLDAALRAMAFVWRTRRDDGSFPQALYPPVTGLGPRGANGNGQVNRYPQWIAAAGDILRAADLCRAHGFEGEAGPTLDWLLAGQEPGGGFRTAHGFAAQISQKDPGPLPDFRDLLPVAGWCDKAFRYLTGLLAANRRADEMAPPAEQRHVHDDDQAPCHPGEGADGGSASPLTAHPTGQTLPVNPYCRSASAAGIPEWQLDCTLRGQRCTFREDRLSVELWCGDRLLYRWAKGAEWAEIHTQELLWK